MDQMIQKDGQIIGMIHPPHCTHDRLQAGKSVVPVYNLEVYGKHTYFVGDDFILVHNPCHRPALSAEEYYRQFVDEGFIKEIEDPDPAHSGGKTLRFMVESGRMRYFVNRFQDLVPKNKGPYSINTNISHHLKELGFVPGTPEFKESLAGREGAVWLLKEAKSQNDFEKVLSKKKPLYIPVISSHLSAPAPSVSSSSFAAATSAASASSASSVIFVTVPSYFVPVTFGSPISLDPLIVSPCFTSAHPASSISPPVHYYPHYLATYTTSFLESWRNSSVP